MYAIVMLCFKEAIILLWRLKLGYFFGYMLTTVFVGNMLFDFFGSLDSTASGFVSGASIMLCDGWPNAILEIV